MKIVKGHERISVDRPIFLIYGQPGIGKTTLGYSAPAPLLLDFDQGAHRAANRGDTLIIDGWPAVMELMADEAALAAYQSIVVDTVGRCLDVLTVDILETSPKLGRDGTLTQQGWGALKTRFRTWMTQLRALGKYVVLLAHEREEKDGDTRIIRPDIVGGSYAEVLKTADFVGYFYLAGRQRLLDFNPTDRWVAKNAAGWRPWPVPGVAEATGTLAKLLDLGREALGQVSAQSARAASQVEEWRDAIDALTDPDEFTQAVEQLQGLEPVVAAQVKKLLWTRAKALGLRFDPKRKQFEGRTPPAAPTAADIPF